MEKTDPVSTLIAFAYKERRWTAEVNRCEKQGTLLYKISYYPVGSVSLKGYVEIIPPLKNSIQPFWKQYRRQLDENLLNAEFISVIGETIQKWQKA